jgi:hypothetical protein
MKLDMLNINRSPKYKPQFMNWPIFQDNVAAAWGQFVISGTWESRLRVQTKGLALIMCYSDQEDQFIIAHWKRIIK